MKKIHYPIILFLSLILILILNIFLKSKKIYIKNIKEINVYTFNNSQKFNGDFIFKIDNINLINSFEKILMESKTKIKFKDSINANDITESYSLKIKDKNSEGEFLLFLFIGKNDKESYIVFLGMMIFITYHLKKQKN
ncbi:hypothetical protein KQI42_12260 [Tissierella sp. MSJ-40]|uniref:Lipoprotein n=1 Tax=Tissierella simiarum TaxID=2841534 RepID=A0ABS6E7P0_9FIRM|nr:hypothetical protein [Tissierella simiarum]MBU5438792.1 hypothetical protein [Tissierella simiarum]